MLMRTVDLNQLGLYLRLQAAKANMSVFDNISQRHFDQSVTTPRWLGSKYRLEQFPKAGPSVRTMFIMLYSRKKNIHIKEK